MHLVTKMPLPSHREAFLGKKPPQPLRERQMEQELKTLLPPPAASQNAAPIIPGPGLRASLRDQANKSSLVGTIAFLGYESVHPADSWVKTSQPDQLNSGAHCHPVLILARQDNLVLCAPCTSWQGKTPQEKFSAASPHKLQDILSSYMELIPDDSSADCATDCRLSFSGPAMEKRTYMSLQRAFWTEVGLIESLVGGSRRLTADSLATACWAYKTAHAWRKLMGVSEKIPEAWIRTQPRGDGLSSGLEAAARRTMASKGGIYKAGGNNWRNKEVKELKQRNLVASPRRVMSGNWRRTATAVA